MFWITVVHAVTDAKQATKANQATQLISSLKAINDTTAQDFIAIENLFNLEKKFDPIVQQKILANPADAPKNYHSLIQSPLVTFQTIKQYLNGIQQLNVYNTWQPNVGMSCSASNPHECHTIQEGSVQTNSYFPGLGW